MIPFGRLRAGRISAVEGAWLVLGRFAGAALRLPVEQNSLCPFGASSFGPNLFCSGDFVALRSLGWVIAITVMGGKDTKILEAPRAGVGGLCLCSRVWATLRGRLYAVFFAVFQLIVPLPLHELARIVRKSAIFLVPKNAKSL